MRNKWITEKKGRRHDSELSQHHSKHRNSKYSFKIFQKRRIPTVEHRHGSALVQGELVLRGGGGVEG